MEQTTIIPRTVRPVARKVSKRFYLGSFIGCLVGIVVLIIILTVATIPMIIAIQAGKGITAGSMMAIGSVIITGILLFLVVIFYTVVVMLLIHKSWGAIQDGHQRMTPGKAVGFLFIPFFNWYWIFQAIWGFSQDYNAYVARYNPGVKKLPENLFLAYCIVSVAGAIPVLSYVTGMASVALMGIVMNELCDGINRLA